MAPSLPRRLGAAALIGALSFGAFASTAAAGPSFTLTRVSGEDRFDTAGAIAANAFAGGTETAIIARGDQFADALPGSYVSGITTGGAPILLTATSSVPASTKSRLASLNVKKVILLGGTGAISSAAEQDLARTYQVSRISGTNRYDTAANIASAPSTTALGSLNGKLTAIVASGESFPDALAAGPLAYSQRFPILLTRQGDLPTETKAALQNLKIKHVLIVGGASSVGSVPTNDIKALGITVEQLAGTNRYATAAAIADFAFANLAGWSKSSVDIVTGESFADALAGGPAAGRANRAILLTRSTALSAETSNWLARNASLLETGRVFGGLGAVNETTRLAAEERGGSTKQG